LSGELVRTLTRSKSFFNILSPRSHPNSEVKGPYDYLRDVQLVPASYLLHPINFELSSVTTATTSSVSRRPKQSIQLLFIFKTKTLFASCNQITLRICHSSPLKLSQGPLQIVISAIFWHVVDLIKLPKRKSVIEAILNFFNSSELKGRRR
jgi:hypothetical protein